VCVCVCVCACVCERASCSSFQQRLLRSRRACVKERKIEGVIVGVWEGEKECV